MRFQGETRDSKKLGDVYLRVVWREEVITYESLAIEVLILLPLTLAKRVPASGGIQISRLVSEAGPKHCAS